MRIPFPERIPLHGAAIFAVALFVVQRLEGTAPYFAAGCLAFILIAVFAFNIAGGLTRASGAYIFFYAVLVVVIGILYKAFLGEPADSNLSDPRTTIEVYVGGISAMCAAAFVSRRFSRREGLMERLIEDSRMYRASIGCIAVGIFASFAIGLLGESAEGLQSAFGQLNDLIPLGIVIGVIYEIRSSGGRRSTNPIIIAAIIFFFIFFGIGTCSKQAMLTPLMCWLVAVCALGYRLSKIQVAGCLTAIFIIFHYLVPFAQHGRTLLTPEQTSFQRLMILMPLLEHPEETRKAYKAWENDIGVGALGEYYNAPQEFWDRLQFISVDDSLINVTDQGKVFGLYPLEFEVLNTVPHFLWPGKPSVNFGMAFVHEIDPGANSEDETTGISFSPTSEAYHMARWVGVLVVAPLVWLAFFIMWDSLLGHLNATPWGLIALVLIAHAAPEAALGGVIHMMTYGTETLIFCALFTIWAAPAIGDAIVGPAKPASGRRGALQASTLLTPRLDHD